MYLYMIIFNNILRFFYIFALIKIFNLVYNQLFTYSAPHRDRCNYLLFCRSAFFFKNIFNKRPIKFLKCIRFFISADKKIDSISDNKIAFGLFSMPPADYISQAGSKASSFQPIHENIRNGRANMVAILNGHNILVRRWDNKTLSTRQNL